MEDVFADILAMEDIEGVMLVSFQGAVLFRKFTGLPASDPDRLGAWEQLVDALRGIQEADFVYEDKRIYIRSTTLGYLLVLLGHFAPVAKLRLNCDVIVPALERQAEGKGKRRLFQRRK